MVLDKAVRLSIQGTTGEKKYFEKLNVFEQNKAKKQTKNPEPNKIWYISDFQRFGVC